MKLNRPVEEQKIEMQYMSTFFRAKEGRGAVLLDEISGDFFITKNSSLINIKIPS